MSPLAPIHALSPLAFLDRWVLIHIHETDSLTQYSNAGAPFFIILAWAFFDVVDHLTLRES